jgi:hypothetical protein
VISLDDRWITRTAQVWGRSLDGEREVTIEGDGSGRGRVNGASAPELDGCLEVDLESSACTNPIPVHRLNLAVDQPAEARLRCRCGRTTLGWRDSSSSIDVLPFLGRPASFSARPETSIGSVRRRAIRSARPCLCRLPGGPTRKSEERQRCMLDVEEVDVDRQADVVLIEDATRGNRTIGNRAEFVVWSIS